MAPNLWNTDCWPGVLRDEVRVQPRRFEGIRRTTAPRVDEDEGRGDLLSTTQTFNFLDQADQLTAWSLAFGEFITLTNLGSWRALAAGKPTGGWVLDDGSNGFWVRNSSLEFGTRRGRLPLGLTAKPAHIDLEVVGGVLEYTA